MLVWSAGSAGSREYRTADRARRTHLELAAHNTLEARGNNLAAADPTSGGPHGNWMRVAD